MQPRIRGGGGVLGGIEGYPLDRLYEEVAYISYYFHWPLEQVLDLEHEERQRWVQQIADINSRLREELGAE